MLLLALKIANFFQNKSVRYNYKSFSEVQENALDLSVVIVLERERRGRIAPAECCKTSLLGDHVERV